MKFLDYILVMLLKLFSSDDLVACFQRKKYCIEINYRKINDILTSSNIPIRPEIKFLHPIFRILPFMGGIISDNLILLNPFSISFYIKYLFAKDKENFLEKILTITIKHELHHIKQSQDRPHRMGSAPRAIVAFIMIYLLFSFFGIQEFIKIIIASIGLFTTYYFYYDEIDARKNSYKLDEKEINYFKTKP